MEDDIKSGSGPAEKNNSKKYTFEYVKNIFFGQTKGGSTFEEEQKTRKRKRDERDRKTRKKKRKRDERGEKTKNKSANRLDKMPIFCSRASEMSSVERQNHRK